MRTVYIYLSWTGWIWLVIAGSYLMWKMRSPADRKAPRGFEVIDSKAEQSNEQ